MTEWAAHRHCFCVSFFVWLKVPATSRNVVIEADYLTEAEGVFVVGHMEMLVRQFVKCSNLQAYISVRF